MDKSIAVINCGYCDAEMDLGFAKQGIKDALVGHPTGVKAGTIRFFVPEGPSQALSMIKELITFAQSVDPSVRFELHTNCGIESSSDLFWAEENFDTIWFNPVYGSSILEEKAASSQSCLPMIQLNPNGSISCNYTALYLMKKELICGSWNSQTKVIDYFPERMSHLAHLKPGFDSEQQLAAP